MAVPVAKTIPTRHAILPIKFAFAACTTSAQDIAWMPGDIALFLNSDASNPYTVTVVSKPKDSRQDLTITAFSLAAGEYCVMPRFGSQDASVLSVVASNVAVKMARLSTKAQPG